MSVRYLCLVLLAAQLQMWAQIPVGNVGVMTTPFAPAAPVAQFFSVNPATSAVSPLAAIPQNLAQRATRIEIDLRTGDLIVGARSASNGGAELNRLGLTGLTVTSQSPALVLNNTDGSTGVQNMERQPDGSILVLTRAPAAAGAPAIPRIFRVCVGELLNPPFNTLGMAATEVPITAQPGDYRALTADAQGNIFVAQSSAGIGTTILTCPPSGGTLAATPLSFPINPLAIRMDLANSGLHAGGLAIPLQGPNYFCPGVAFNYETADPMFNDIVQSIGRSLGSPALYVGSTSAASGGTVWSVQGCAPPGTQVTFFASQSIASIVPVSASMNYGCGCPTSQGLIPQISSPSAPVAGGNWTLVLTNGLPNLNAFLIFGEPMSPNPIPGAPGCFLVSTRPSTFPVNVGANGTAVLNVAIPLSLAGTTISAQWILRDASANPSGLTVSGGLAADV